MRLAATALLFGASTFGQNALSQDQIQRHLKSLKLLVPSKPGTRVVFLGRAPIPAVCAVPLLQALPPNDHTDYKLRIFKPPAPVDSKAVTPAIPHCN
jgi:hypothetical protein